MADPVRLTWSRAVESFTAMAAKEGGALRRGGGDSHFSGGYSFR